MLHWAITLLLLKSQEDNDPDTARADSLLSYKMLVVPLEAPTYDMAVAVASQGASSQFSDFTVQDVTGICMENYLYSSKVRH